jgi:hypothetical protein
MSRSFRFAVIVCLASMLMPGLFEALENGAHLLREGHLAHAEATEDHHDPASDEHGCTPTLHLCGCHASLAFLVPHAAPPPALGSQDSRAMVEPKSPLSQFSSRLERPPQA